jgi:hypothetical protein
MSTHAFVSSPAEGGTELMRKVRMMNQGLRATFALMAQPAAPARPVRRN